MTESKGDEELLQLESPQTRSLALACARASWSPELKMTHVELVE